MEGNIPISKLDDEFLWSIIVINSTLIFLSEWKEVLKYHYTRQTLPAYQDQYMEVNVCPAGISSVLERLDSVWAHPAPLLPTIFPCGYVRSGNVETDHCVNWSSLGTGHSTSHHTPVSAKILCM